jgi:RNA polymerase sigma factor (sigma-70 family)
MTFNGNGDHRKPRVEDNIALAVRIAHRNVTLRRGESILDTYEYSDALVGLMKACEKFDPDRRTESGDPIEFSTYAWRVIQREINYGRKTRARQNRLNPILLGELQGSDLQDGRGKSARNGVFEIPDNHKPPLPLHLLEEFFKPNEHDTMSQQRYKRLLYDYYMENLTYEELGERHHITRERVRQLIGKGLQLIQRQYADEIEAAQE